MAIAPAPRKRGPRSKAAEPVLPEIIELTPEQAWTRFDAYTRTHLGMTGQEYNAAWDRGELAERIEENHVQVASFLMSDPPGAGVG